MLILVLGFLVVLISPDLFCQHRTHIYSGVYKNKFLVLLLHWGHHRISNGLMLHNWHLNGTIFTLRVRRGKIIYTWSSWRTLIHYSSDFFKTDLNGSNDSNGIFISFCSCVVPRTSPLLTAQSPVLFAKFWLSGVCLEFLLLKWRHVTGKLASPDVTCVLSITKT